MLYLIGTPIGNLDDLSIRAARTLLEADIILAEDTRSVQTLLKRAREIMINVQFSISETPSAPPHLWGGTPSPRKEVHSPGMVSYCEENHLTRLQLCYNWSLLE